MIINIIQDLATPHNNVLIAQFKNRTDVKINLWYTKEVDNNRYPWSTNITHEHFQASLYGDKFSFRFLIYILTHPKEKFLVVGWMNMNTRLLHLLFFLLRRKYNHWTDYPNPEANKFRYGQNIFRNVSYFILKYSKCNVFCVGKSTMEYFYAKGFSKSRVVNLPIFVEVEPQSSLVNFRHSICDKYNIPEDKFLIVSGSRLIFEKGFDLLINAVNLIDDSEKSGLFVVIVGSGNEKNNLDTLLSNLKLTNKIKIIDWMAISDFKNLISSSDLFIQPSRFDSYGGTILGMSLGVPVIGSIESGAAFDRIQHGENGYLYNCHDIESLAKYIVEIKNNDILRIKFAQESIKTALKWPPDLGVDILIQNII